MGEDLSITSGRGSSNSAGDADMRGPSIALQSPLRDQGGGELELVASAAAFGKRSTSLEEPTSALSTYWALDVLRYSTSRYR